MSQKKKEKNSCLEHESPQSELNATRMFDKENPGGDLSSSNDLSKTRIRSKNSQKENLKEKKQKKSQAEVLKWSLVNIGLL